MFKLAGIIAALSFAAQANAACPKNTTQHSVNYGGKITCALEGTIVEDTYLTNSHTYVLKGGVFIGSDNGKGGAEMVLDSAVLTIDPGTTIYALNPKKDLRLPEAQRKDRKDFLVISRGSKIIAEGTENSPIVFTSAQGAHTKQPTAAMIAKRGDWGGLFLNGQAPSNKCVDVNKCVLEGEAGTGFYAGNKATDGSGALRYVRVEYGGDKITEEKEFNGITFNAAGSNTKVEYIQVHMNNDDGVEFFGGTVNANYVVITGAGDDSVDWTDGYTGALQFVLVVQDKAAGDRGVEADNDKKNPNKTPRSNPYISNMTLIGSGAGKEALKLRRGTSATIVNSVIYGFNNCADSKEADSSLVLENNVFACADFGTAKSFQDNEFVSQTDLGLDTFMPVEDSMLLGEGFIDPTIKLDQANAEKFKDLDTTIDFIGAFGEDDNWADAWTVKL